MQNSYMHAAYTNILRRDLNTTCITIICGMWCHGPGPIRGGWMTMEAFWSKPSVKVEIKTTWEVVSTCEVLWSARLNTSKVTENWLEDRSSQWEATKRSVGLSTARVVDAHKDQYQWRWTATVRHLICVNDQCMRLNGRDRNSDRHCNSSTTVEVIWRQKSTTELWAHSAACIRSLAKLSLATFSVIKPANWL